MNQKITDFTLKFKGKQYACAAPCSQYSVLMLHGVIGDLHYRDNEKKYLDIGRENCEFSSLFDIDSAVYENERLTLKFLGIDTLAEVFLNGKFLGKTDNMHRIWEFDIKKLAKQKANELIVKFQSPSVYCEKRNEKYNHYTPPFSLEGYMHMRKSFCSFGWDWGPIVPEVGFYRDVVIVGLSRAEISDLYIRQHFCEEEVCLHISADIRYKTADVKAKYYVIAPNGKTINVGELSGDCARVCIDNPQLWWPNGYGAQPLYTVVVEVFDGGILSSRLQRKIGLRTLKVSTAKDKWGNEFCFVVNDKKIFSMGANCIPMDSILSKVDKKKTEQLIDDCIFANFNTLRVWGGGYYPDDYFFELCDEKGIIVWLDFMFAGGVIEVDGKTEETVRKEIEQQIKRVRNHACMGLLCGNNEIEEAWATWNLPNYTKLKYDYLKLFEGIMPDMVAELSDIFFWPSSPSTRGSFVDPQSESAGDAHCWTIWIGQQPIEKYREKFFRFCSEYGHESFPSIKTLKTVCEETDLNPFSPIMDCHQKAVGGNVKIIGGAAAYLPYAMNFVDLIYTSQLIQAEAVRVAAEHFRRNRERCKGSLYWQLNDNWQTASWSSVDYLHRYKALHYFAKRFYLPLLLSATECESTITLNLSSEKLQLFKGEVKWKLITSDYSVLKSGSIKVTAEPLSSKDIAVLNFSDDIKGRESDIAFCYTLKEKDTVISEEVLLFVRDKYFNFKPPQLFAEVFERDGYTHIAVKSSAFAKNVELDFENGDAVLEDNFFSLCHESGRTVKVLKTDLIAEEIEKQLKINCVNYLCNAKD